MTINEIIKEKEMRKLIVQLFILCILLVVIINLLTQYWPIIFVLLVLIIIAKVLFERGKR